ncbi:hypothetical protein EXIGLDRAFT_183494 [Exidia glandulosa HHB12029]|uniref:Uncharacterized protein n=1 Tax=Exidia glandulosa HHB12029 TaxID=1314781 RepID=A0A165F2F6_EXIGL|nr:hypothetical protein EXIGLDRAFT_183494 [Exidia glandulosa HHB12029]
MARISFRSVDGAHGDTQIFTLGSTHFPDMQSVLRLLHIHDARARDRHAFIFLSLILAPFTPSKVQVTQSVYSTAYDAMYTTYRRNWSLTTHGTKDLDRLCRARDRGRRAMDRWYVLSVRFRSGRGGGSAPSTPSSLCRASLTCESARANAPRSSHTQNPCTVR